MQFSEMAESELKYSGFGQIQQEMAIIKWDLLVFIKLWILSCQAKNKKYYHVVIM